MPECDGGVIEIQEVSEMTLQREINELKKEQESLELTLKYKRRHLEGLRKAYSDANEEEKRDLKKKLKQKDSLLQQKNFVIQQKDSILQLKEE